MISRFALALSAIALISTNTALAQEGFVPVEGKQVTITLMSCAAADFIQDEYLPEPSATPSADSVFIFQAVANITNVNSDGTFDVESDLTRRKKNGVVQRLTITATISHGDETVPITTTTSPVGTLIYSSPSDTQPRATREEIQTVKIDLSGAKTRIQTWVLSDDRTFE